MGGSSCEVGRAERELNAPSLLMRRRCCHRAAAEPARKARAGHRHHAVRRTAAAPTRVLARLAAASAVRASPPSRSRLSGQRSEELGAPAMGWGVRSRRARAAPCSGGEGEAAVVGEG